MEKTETKVETQPEAENPEVPQETTLRDNILKQIGSVSSIPASGVQVIRLLLNPNVNMGEIVQAIKYDPGLTSNILKLANSSYFGLSRSIGSLREAVVRLGTSNLFTLVTTSMANVALNRPVKGYGMSPGELWDHSMAVAVAAENTGDMLMIKTETTKMAFTAGLLHDIGKILLGNFIKKDAKRDIEILLDKGVSFVDAEKEVLGIDHAELGGLLLQEWNFPEELKETIRWHHEPERCPENEISAVIHVADYVCVFNRIGTKRKNLLNTAFSQETFRKLNFSNKYIQEIVERTRTSLENIKDVFSKHE
jgi:putative nucleotidyltransferase with HDIG domain